MKWNLVVEFQDIFNLEICWLVCAAACQAIRSNTESSVLDDKVVCLPQTILSILLHLQLVSLRLLFVGGKYTVHDTYQTP